MNGKRIFVILTVLLALSPLAAYGGDRSSAGAVYVMSNDPEGNEVVVFERDVHGRLTQARAYATEGLGSGGDNVDPLGSQGALALSSNRRWLFAVNAGSNDISVFRVRRDGLTLVEKYDSGGPFPVSLAFHRNLLFVLNAGQDDGGPNIVGYMLNRRGELTPLPGAVRSLGAGGFHQVGFTPRGDALVVTQGEPSGTNAILVFGVDEEGVPDAAPTISPSAGVVPFGFIFDRRMHLLVSEAGSGAVSSYALREDNTLEILDASVPNGNLATCWIAGTWYGSVFTANTASDNISVYKAHAGSGRLRLAVADAASGDKPIDMQVTRNGRFLYVLNAADGSVSAFRISPRGGIKEDLGKAYGLPEVYAQGIAVR